MGKIDALTCSTCQTVIITQIFGYNVILIELPERLALRAINMAHRLPSIALGLRMISRITAKSTVGHMTVLDVKLRKLTSKVGNKIDGSACSSEKQIVQSN